MTSDPANRPPRIVSLVPNGTEILFALGAGDRVVGVSHECDFPPEASKLPQLTGSALDAGLSASEIDSQVAAQVGSGESLYTLDEDAIARLEPDLIVTQTLCPVCAVSTKQVDEAVAPLSHCPELLTLDPHTLTDVLEDIQTVGRVIGSETEAEHLVDNLRKRLERIRASTADRSKPRNKPRDKPRVLALEWLDPPFLGGHWVPEMIAAAGGIDAARVEPGETSRRATWEEIAQLDPDVIIAMPCGFDETGAQAQIAAMSDQPHWSSLRAVKNGRTYAVDANGLFSRPGPRLFDGVERLARLLRVAVQDREKV